MEQAVKKEYLKAAKIRNLYVLVNSILILPLISAP